MKVLQVAYKSEITGGEQVLLQLCRTLLREGHLVEVLCPGPGELPAVLEKMGVPVRFERLAKTYDLFAVWRMARLIRRESYSIVHTHGMLVNVLGRLACRLAGGTANVSTVHLTRDLGGAPRVGGIGARLKNAFYYRLLDNWTVSFCAKVVAVSRAVRADLLEQGVPEEKILVIPNGIDPGDFDEISSGECDEFRRELGCDVDAPLIGMVARLSPQKDIPCFLGALERLRESHPRMRAFVAGSGPSEHEIRRRVADLDLGKVVRLLGHRKDAARLIRSCDVFVLSSRWEGLPLTVLEAMACSRPVVATAVDGTVEAVVNEETGLLVPPGDALALESALRRLLDDPELRLRYGRAGRRRLEERFHVDRVAQSHLRLYESLVADRSGANGTERSRGGWGDDESAGPEGRAS